MAQNEQNGGSSKSLPPSQDEFPFVDDQLTALLSPCEHFARANFFLRIADRNWQDASKAAALAKVAEVHLQMADRFDDLGACDER